MGLSIKRADTEMLARRLAQATGQSLTDAIHEAIALRLKVLGQDARTVEQKLEDLRAWHAEIDRLPVLDPRTREEFEADMYDESGLPR
ncbi:MAG TPA: type II toxin-antitoxin system VapB family antitoxin [Caulobacteraceae bacterium]|nr:type II toxin-antitoxin system VapB family antitoxin [Caulobacteraceae bacterium]